MNVWALPARMIKDWRCRGGGTLKSAPCGALGADAGGVDLTFDEHHLKESASEWSELS
jgi:hypothetical protein